MIAMNSTKKPTIDAAGRLVIPKAIREQAGVEAGMPLEVRCRDGVIELRPAPRAVRIVSEGLVRVARPEEPGEVLTEEQVRVTRDRIRDERAE